MPREFPPDCPYPDRARAVAEAFAAFMQRRGLTQQPAAKRLTKCSPSVLSQVLSGTYPGDWQRVIADMARVVDRDEAERRAIALPDLARTDILNAVQGLIVECRDAHCLGFVYSLTGMGKSVAAEAYAATDPSATYLRCRRHETLRAFIRRLAGALHLGSDGTYDATVDAVTRELAARGGPLIIIDEMDLNPKVAHLARQLHDETGCGMVWIGTPAFLAGLRRRNEGIEGQALGRIATRLTVDDLTHLSLADARAILTPYGLSDDLVKRAHALSCGNTRRLCQGCRAAKRRAHYLGQPLAVTHIDEGFAAPMPYESLTS